MNNRGAIVPGLILIALGLWFLADALGWQLPGLGELWPIFPLGFGIAMLAQFILGGRRDEGLVFTGLTGLLTGIFFFAITLGPLDWGDLGRYWPVFPLIGGIGFLAQWLVKPSERGLLVPALGGLAVGGIGLLFTLNLLGSSAGRLIANFWPVALILLGIGLLANYMLSGRKKQS